MSQKTEGDEVSKWFNSLKVLVVDPDNHFLHSTASLLQSFQFQVTSVDHVGEALRLVCEEENEFDLLLIDSHIPHVDVHTFLKVIKNKDLLSMVMSEEHDDETLMLEAFENGAFLVLKKPLTDDEVKSMRQHAVEKKLHKKNKNIHDIDNRSVGNKRKRMEHVNKDKNPVHHEVDEHDRVEKWACVWTQELHQKFLKAINELGDGRCFPKPIVERMGVPGLIRNHVASHLQKCRNGEWKIKEKLGILPNSSSNQRGYRRMFGSKPFFQSDQNKPTDRSLSLHTEVDQMQNHTSGGLDGSNQKNIGGQGGDGPNQNKDVNQPTPNQNSNF